MKKSIYIFLFITLIIGACKKQTVDPPVTPPVTKYKVVEVKTAFGSMIMWLYPATPKHRDNFLKLASEKFFDSTIFHRCVSNFVIQGGDPLSKDADPSNDGTGGPGYTIDAEIDSSKIKHDYGAVGAARTGNSVNPQRASNGSQFYIVTPQAGTHFLDGEYTVFGKIIKGMDVAENINKQPKLNDKPKTNIYMSMVIIEKTADELKTEYNFVP